MCVCMYYRKQNTGNKKITKMANKHIAIRAIKKLMKITRLNDFSFNNFSSGKY